MMQKWWHDKVVYQIYPKSFMDSNNDGTGDLQGIISKLDYLKELGIGIIWLSPVYDSPMDDNGYDISNYENIAPEFGTMKDMDELIAEANKRDIKVIMDLVVNHTSDEHPWFLEARKTKDNRYRDYYVWRDGKGGKEPSDIRSWFSGSAWQHDEQTGQYYLHLFSKKQPDLNWDNENLRKDIYDMMNFWLDKGISGFRMDVIELIGKDIDKGILGNTDKTHEYIQEMHEKTFGRYDSFTVGETGGATIERAKLYSSPERKELNMVFQFQHIALDEQRGKSKWDLKELNLIELKDVLSIWQIELGTEGWNSVYWNNHDQPRIVSRWGNDKKYRVESAKMLGTILHFMKGTPYIYQGEEIGMTNAYFQDIKQCKDIETLNLYKERIEASYSHEEIMKSILVKGRDNARTPMQWNSEANGGFTKGTPWIEVNKNYVDINVERALKDRYSVFHYYKKLVDLRKNNALVVYGDYELINREHPQVFSYIRTYNNERLLVICNFYGSETEFKLPESIAYSKKEIIISNYDAVEHDIESFTLAPYEAVVYKLV